MRAERKVFAPKNARNAKNETYFRSKRESQSLAMDTTFPLMRFSVEIRLIIYEFHFLRAGEVAEAENQCPAGESCCTKKCNRDVPVRML